MHKFMKSVLTAGGLILAVSAGAATTTTTFPVSASVSARCLVSATALAFGAYDPGQGDKDQTSSISVRCTKNTAYNVALDAGLAPAATVTNRRMRSTATPANELAYALYLDTTRTTNWGNTTGFVATGTGNGVAPANAITHTVYGRVPDNATNQNAVVATDYADTITVTVNY